MTSAINISIYVLMASSLVILILEAIGNRQMKMGFAEKSHIRLVAVATLAVSFFLLFLDVYQDEQAYRRPLLFIDQIGSIFLVLNTAISLFIGRNTQTHARNVEADFLILSQLALAISSVSTSNLILKMVCSVAFLVAMTALAVRSTRGGKKAEIGLKMSFSIIIFVLFFLFGIFLLCVARAPLDLHAFVLSDANFKIAFFGLILLTFAGISLAGAPPFHLGHIDCADGGSLAVAFLFLSNSAIQGCSLLLRIKTILLRSGLNIDDESNILGVMLIFGFMVLYLRSLDQSKIRRTAAYIAVSGGPLLCMSVLFGVSVLLPKLIFLLAIYTFLTLTLFTLFGSLLYMEPIESPWQTWEDMSGFGRRNPVSTLTFLVALASIAGLPGTIGYFIKLSLIAPLHESVLFSGSVFLSIAIGAASIMRVFVFMFSKQPQFTDPQAVAVKPSLTLVAASTALIVLGLFPFVR